MKLECYDESAPFTQEQWDYIVKWRSRMRNMTEFERIESFIMTEKYRGEGPLPGDGLYIGDDEAGNPVYVEIEADVTPMFMGEVNGCPVWTM